MFSADLYASDRRKYQFQTDAESVTADYFKAVAFAFQQGAALIQCVAIYDRAVCERQTHQAPVKVWHQVDNRAAGQSSTMIRWLRSPRSYPVLVVAPASI